MENQIKVAMSNKGDGAEEICENNSTQINFSIMLSPEKASEFNEILNNVKNDNTDLVAENIISLFSESKYPYKNANTLGEIEKTATKLISEFSIPAHTKGYRYLREAIVLVAQKPELIDKVTKYLYPIIAKSHNTTSVRVERVIRHAIESSCAKGDMDVVYSYFPHCATSERGRPTNSEFIAVLSYELRERSANRQLTFMSF